MANAPRDRLLALVKGFNELSTTKKVGIGATTLTIAAVVAGLFLWSQTVEYKVLFSNLADKDGGAILTALQQQNIPYKTADNGTAILIPADKVYETRLKLASQGLPKGSNTGFELMENQKLGISQFLEQVNYQRALEGELSRSIQSINSIEEARVHLAIPKPSVFVREQLKPSASVVLTLHRGRTLDPGQVSGIVNLVAASVPDLPPKNVTIVDQNGTLLSNNDETARQNGLDPTQLEYVRQIEKSYVKRIENILSPIMGQSNVRAQVTADVDFSQEEQTSESYGPNQGEETKPAVRSQQTTEAQENSPNPPVGVPGALSNQPPGAANAPLNAPAGANTATGNSAQNSRKETTTNFEVDKTIRHVKRPVGKVRRVAVAVVVNYRKKVDPKTGEVTFVALTPAEITQINNLVREAMGYDQKRGDTLNVANQSFNIETPEEIPFWKRPEFLDLVRDVMKNILIGGVFLYLIFGIIRPMVRRLMQPTPPPDLTLLEGLDDVDGDAAGTALSESAAGGSKISSYEEKLSRVRAIAKENPRLVATVIREWLEGPGD